MTAECPVRDVQRGDRICLNGEFLTVQDIRDSAGSRTLFLYRDDPDDEGWPWLICGHDATVERVERPNAE